MSADGRLAAVSYGPAAAGAEGDCLLWDFSRGREIARVKGIWAQFSADSQTLFTFEAYDGNRVMRYDVGPKALADPSESWQKGTEVYRGQAGEKINTGTLAADGLTLAVAATDSVIFLDTTGKDPPRTWANSAHFVGLSGDGRWVSTVRHKEKPMLFDRRGAQPVYGSEPYSQIHLSPDSRWFSVATRTSVEIHACDGVAPGYPAIQLEAPGSAVPVAFSPDGQMFAVPLNRTHVHLYETVSGRELATLSPPNPAPIKGAEALNFSPNGQWLLAARDDGETVAWNLPAVRGELRKLGLDWSVTNTSRNVLRRAMHPERDSITNGAHVGVDSTNKPFVSDPEPGALPPELTAFVIAKEQQARSLAKTLNGDLPPDVAEFFNAARLGHWQQASNTYGKISRHLDAAQGKGDTSGLQRVRYALWETYVALENFSRGQPKYATAVSRHILASISTGSIYFGGTDSGRGLLTALGRVGATADPFSTISQNALADRTYLEHLRQTYGQRIYIPTEEDTQAAFQEYTADAQRRLEHDRDFPTAPRQVKPGENIAIVNDRIQINGYIAAMGVNAILAKVIFDKNPQLDFYLEESVALEWMYPHLEPHGLILRLNRTPFARLAPDLVKRDHEFWSAYMKPLIGGWLGEDTPLPEVLDFAERVFVRKDFKGFAGDPAYLRDADACRAFSRLRSSIAGLYHWRGLLAKDQPEREEMNRAADFAFRQALALCPYNREAVSRYIRLLANEGRSQDALRIATLGLKFAQTQAPAAKWIHELTVQK